MILPTRFTFTIERTQKNMYFHPENGLTTYYL